jgi:hypothetical protein
MSYILEMLSAVLTSGAALGVYRNIDQLVERATPEFDQSSSISLPEAVIISIACVLLFSK